MEDMVVVPEAVKNDQFQQVSHLCPWKLFASGNLLQSHALISPLNQKTSRLPFKVSPICMGFYLCVWKMDMTFKGFRVLKVPNHITDLKSTLQTINTITEVLSLSILPTIFNIEQFLISILLPFCHQFLSVLPVQPLPQSLLQTNPGAYGLHFLPPLSLEVKLLPLCSLETSPFVLDRPDALFSFLSLLIVCRIQYCCLFLLQRSLFLALMIYCSHSHLFSTLFFRAIF